MCVGEGVRCALRSVLLVEVCWILNSDVYGADIDAHTVVSASNIPKIRKLGG